MSGVGRNQLELIADSLSTRDWSILSFLSRFRYATTAQLRRVHFTGHLTETAATRACIRVLDRLLAHRLVTRLERRIGGIRRGSAGFVWHLDVAGERLTRPEPSGRRRYEDPSHAFLDHALDVTEAAVTLHELTLASDLTLTELEVEPAAWRSYLSAAGTRAILKPDLFATVSSTDYDDHWYIEIDRGTESLPVLLAKSRAYAAYRRTGRAQAEHGVFPRVLWVLPTQRRLDRLQAALRADPDLPDRLFAAITPEQLTATIRDQPDSLPLPAPTPATHTPPEPKEEEAHS